ncbi:MAG: cytochrome c [Planctomycetes bacterium]|nr:cytochrome c [Planctomycetota bacterium]
MKYKKVLLLSVCCLISTVYRTGCELNASAVLKKEFKVEDIDKKVVQTHMDRVDAFVKWLDDAIKKKNWDKIMLYARHVDSLGELLLSANVDTKNIPQEFFEIDQKFQEARDFIIEASEKKDVKVIRDEFKRMQKTCKECHAKYKK